MHNVRYLCVLAEYLLRRSARDSRQTHPLRLFALRGLHGCMDDDWDVKVMYVRCPNYFGCTRQGMGRAFAETLLQVADGVQGDEVGNWVRGRRGTAQEEQSHLITKLEPSGDLSILPTLRHSRGEIDNHTLRNHAEIDTDL